MVTYYDVRKLVTISIINAVAIPCHSNTIRTNKIHYNRVLTYKLTISNIVYNYKVCIRNRLCVAIELETRDVLSELWQFSAYLYFV